MPDPLSELQQAMNAANAAEARFDRFRSMADDGGNLLTRLVGRFGTRLTLPGVMNTAEHADMLSELAALDRRNSLEP